MADRSSLPAGSYATLQQYRPMRKPAEPDSWWDTFRDNITPDSAQTLATIAGTVAGGVTKGVDYIWPDKYHTKQIPAYAMQDPRWRQDGYHSTDFVDRTDETFLGRAFSTSATITTPVKVGAETGKIAESHTMRALSVANQAGNRFNPLYQDGLQLEDFHKMWVAATNDEWEGQQGNSPGISVGQSAWWNLLAQIDRVRSGDVVGGIKGFLETATPIGLASTLSDAATGNLEQEAAWGAQANNIYDPVQQKLRYDNSLFAIATGVTDAALQIVLGKGLDDAALAMRGVAGLNTKIDTIRDVNKAMSKGMGHVLWEETGGQQGKWNRYGYEATRVANSNNVGDIATNPLFAGSDNALQIGHMLQNVTDPVTVLKVWAADHGDRYAIASLMRDDPSVPWRLFDGRAKMQWQQLVDDLPVVTDDNAPMFQRIYDSTLDQPGNEWYRQAYDMWLGKNPATADEATRIGMTPDEWFAIPEGERGLYNSANAIGSREAIIDGPVFGRVGAAGSQKRLDTLNGAGWDSQVLGNAAAGEPTTILVRWGQWAMGRRPRGVIDSSGMQPHDVIAEIRSQLGSLKFARGNRTWQYVDEAGELQQVTSKQFFDTYAERLAAARVQGGLQSEAAVLDSLQQDLLSAVIRMAGVSKEDAAPIVKALVDGKNTALEDIKRGFYFDSAQNRVVFDAMTQRELVDSYIMLPFEDIFRELRGFNLKATGQGAKRGVLGFRHGMNGLYESIQKYVRTEQLIRPSYLKNSTLEPAGARLAQQGIDTALSLTGEGIVGTANWLANRAKSLGMGAQWVGDRLVLTGGSRASRRLLKLEADRKILAEEYNALQALQEVADHPNLLSPSRRQAIKSAIAMPAAQAKAALAKIHRELDLEAPQWRSTDEAMSFHEVRAEVAHLERVAENPTKYVYELQRRLAVQQADDEVSFARAQEAAARRLTVNNARLRSIEARLALAEREDADVLRAQHDALKDLQYHEQRLAWARKTMAGETSPMQQERINEAQRALDQLQARRDKVAAKLAEPTGDVLDDTATAPRTGLLDDLDQRIAEQQRRLESAKATQGSLEDQQAAREILDTYPERIRQIRADLGDNAPASGLLPEQADELERLREAVPWQQRMIREYQAQKSREIREYEASLPKFDEDEFGERVFRLGEDDWNTVKAQAAESFDEETARLEFAPNNLQRSVTNPFKAAMNQQEYSMFSKRGIVTLSWAEKALAEDPEGFWVWLHNGVTDWSGPGGEAMYAAAQTQAKVGELRMMAQSLRQAFPNEGLRSNAQIIRMRWAEDLSDMGMKRRMQEHVDEFADQQRQGLAMQYDEMTGEIDDMRAALDDDLTAMRAEVADLEQRMDELARAEGALFNGEKGYGNPVPSPNEAEALRRQREAIRQAILRDEEATAGEFAYSPRVTDIEVELAKIEKLGGSQGLAEKIADLKERLADAAAARLALSNSNPADRMKEIEAGLADIYSKAGIQQGKMLASRKRIDWLKARRTQTHNDLNLNVSGQRMTVPGLFAEGDFGDARRLSFSASASNKLTFDPGQTSIAKPDYLAMANGSATIYPTNPQYFDDLTFIANRHVSGDPFAGMILDGADNAQVVKWMQSPAGQKWLAEHGWDESQLQPYVSGAVADTLKPGAKVPVWDDGKINSYRRILDQYFPTEDAKRLVSMGGGGLKPSELQAAMVGADLRPIQGHALETALMGDKNVGYRWIMRAVDSAWDWLATKPENVLRMPFGNRAYKIELEKRLGMLAEQGMRLTSAEYNAVKMGAMRAAVRESKRTFYNIERYSNPVYASRYLLVYPQAVFNTMWRAGRMAWNRPGTALVMNNAWQQMMAGNTPVPIYAVDENGDKTEDYNSADSLIVGVPEWLQTKAAVGPEMKWPIGTWQLLSDRQGATWTVQVPLQTLLMHRPDMSETLKTALGPAYEFVFPWGTPSGLNDYTVGPVPTGAWVPNYVKAMQAAYAGIMSDDGNDRLNRVASQIIAYQAATGQKINIEKASEQASWYWAATTVANAVVPGGGGLQGLGQIERDGVREILNRYGGDEVAALPEIAAAYPKILDPKALVASTSEYSAYLPATVDAYSMVTDNKLAGTIRKIVADGNGDPEMVSILVADKTGPFDPNVYDSYDALVLPGDNDPVRDRPTATVKAARLEAQKVWDTYNNGKALIQAELLRRGLKSMPPAMQEAWNTWVDSLEDQPGGKTWAAQYGKSDRSVTRRALDTLQIGLTDPAMKQYNMTPYWQAAGKYLANLPAMQAAYSLADSTEKKNAITAAWDGWVAQQFGTTSPEFVGIYNKYLAERDVKL